MPKITQWMKRLRILVVAAAVCVVAGSAPITSYQTTFKHIQSGIASYYADGMDGFLWKKTASGYVITPDSLIAAHRTLPFGTEILVTNTKTGVSVVVTVRDRGPYIKGRILDLSHRAAQVLGLTEAGKGHVTIQQIVRTSTTINEF